MTVSFWSVSFRRKSDHTTIVTIGSKTHTCRSMTYFYKGQNQVGTSVYISICICQWQVARCTQSQSRLRNYATTELNTAAARRRRNAHTANAHFAAALYVHVCVSLAAAAPAAAGPAPRPCLRGGFAGAAQMRRRAPTSAFHCAAGGCGAVWGGAGCSDMLSDMFGLRTRHLYLTCIIVCQPLSVDS